MSAAVADWPAAHEALTAKRATDVNGVATANGGTPCGSCRQVMAELGPEMTVYISDAAGSYSTTTVHALLPDSFGPQRLAEGLTEPRA